MTGQWPPPTDKTPEMQALVSALSGAEGNVYDRADCAWCDKINLRPEDFRDDLSRVEFGLSRLCQSCQDAVYGRTS